MPTVFTLIVVLGLIGAATFLVGFTKGVREAVSEYRNPQPEGAWSDEGHYGLSALFAVVASAVVPQPCRDSSRPRTARGPSTAISIRGIRPETAARAGGALRLTTA